MKVTQEKIDLAFKRAYQTAARHSRRTGVPLVFMRDGVIVEEIPPDPDLPNPEATPAKEAASEVRSAD